MKATVNMKVGSVGYTFDVEDDKEMDTLHKAIVLGNPRAKCDVCGDIGFNFKKLDTNKDKEGNTYVNVVCLKGGCGSKSKLGQYKAGGYFWREYEKWEGNKTAQTTTKTTEDVDPKDIPF